MAINLEKGERFNLEKEAPGLTSIHVGLSWDASKNPAHGTFDLDASAFMLGADGKLKKEANFIYFRNLKSPCGSVVHTGDNLTGDGDGDDEVLYVDLSKVPEDVNEIVFLVNLFQAEAKRQNFGMVSNACIRLLDRATNKEIVKYDLSEDYSAATYVEFGKLYRKDGTWRFQAVGEGSKGDLQTALNKYRG